MCACPRSRPWTAVLPSRDGAGTCRRSRTRTCAALIRARRRGVRPRSSAFTLRLPNGSQGDLDASPRSTGCPTQFAVYLREVAGFAPGDRIAIQMPNCLAYPVVVFGALKAGLVMVNTNPLYTPPEMAHQFADSGAAGLVTIDLFADEGRARCCRRRRSARWSSCRSPICCRRSSALLVWAVQKYVKKMIPAIALRARHLRRAPCARGQARLAAGADPRRLCRRRSTHDTLAALQYTGGTTGVAKGAMLTHGNLLANIEQCLQAWRPWLRVGEEVMLTALPLYHIFAFTANLMLFFVTGGRDILIPSPRPLTNLQTGAGRPSPSPGSPASTRCLPG